MVKLSLRSLGDEDTTVHGTRTSVFVLPNPCCTIAPTLPWSWQAPVRLLPPPAFPGCALQARMDAGAIKLSLRSLGDKDTTEATQAFGGGALT